MQNQKIAIGIYIDNNASIQQLIDTLYYLSTNISTTFSPRLEIITLCDNQNLQLQKFISQLSYDVIKLSPKQSGRTFYFNNFIKVNADYFLFLDCGIFLAPECIKLLMTALLDNEPTQISSKVGIVGPSSNNGWNQQSLFNDSTPETINIKQRSQNIAHQYKNKMAPMQALQESCLMLSAQVIKTTGYADENFKDGYCWEIDYQIRSNIAGFSCLWVKSAYAHKSYLANNLARDKSFSKNIQLFHDIHSNNPLSETTAHNKSPLKTKKTLPLISCIMPTRGRAHFVKQSIKYFNRQTYPNKELIIIYDQATDLPENIYQLSNVYLFKTAINSSIGHKRNIALKHSRGEIIAHWDDDDWHSSKRLFEQVKPLLEGHADISALYNTLFFNPFDWKAWQITPQLYQSIFVEGVHGGTLMYKTEWIGNTQFLDISLREDAIFLKALIDKGARLAKINGRNLYTYIRHNNNSWCFESGVFEDPNGWGKIDINQLLNQDIHYYSQYCHKNINPPEIVRELENLSEDTLSYSPRVSCIMPTKNRNHFVIQAIKYFLRQTYKNKELIIIDDTDDDTNCFTPPNVSNIKYLRLNKQQTIGYKRNLANSIAEGEIIIHWDDDDWMAENWIDLQVLALIKSQADVTGIREAYYYKPDTQQAWKYRYPQYEKEWLLGGSLCYFKKFWQKNKFSEISIGEDSEFLWTKLAKKIVPHFHTQHYIGIIHSANTSPKRTNDSYWQEIELKEIKKMMTDDINYYEKIE